MGEFGKFGHAFVDGLQGSAREKYVLDPDFHNAVDTLTTALDQAVQLLAKWASDPHDPPRGETSRFLAMMRVSDVKDGTSA